MSILGTIVTGLFAGLALTDMTITIGELATQGSFIRPEINNRRALMEELAEEAESVSDEFEEKLSAYIALRNDVANSYETNKIIFNLFGSHFQTLSDEHARIAETGVFEELLGQNPPPPGTIPEADAILRYTAGVFYLLNSGAFMRNTIQNFQSPRTFLGNIKQARIELHNVKVVLKTKIPIEVANRVMGSNLPVKRPLRTARMKLFTSIFTTPTLAAVSVASVTQQVRNAIALEEEINANIQALRNFIDAVKGDIEPSDDEYLEGVDTEEADVPVSIADLNTLKGGMEELEGLDLEAFQGLVDFVDVHFRQVDGAEFLEVLPSQEEQAAAFFSGLLLHVFKPGLVDPESGCAEEIANAEAYSVADMRCVQSQLREFVQQEGLAFIVLMAASVDLNNLLGGVAGVVSSVCDADTAPTTTSNAEDLYCRMHTPLESTFSDVTNIGSLIEIEVRDGGLRNEDGTLSQPYGGVCNGVSLFDEFGEFLFAEAGSATCPSVDMHTGVSDVCGIGFPGDFLASLVEAGNIAQEGLLCFMRDEVLDEGFDKGDQAILDGIAQELRNGGVRSATDFFTIETKWEGRCHGLPFFDANNGFLYSTFSFSDC